MLKLYLINDIYSGNFSGLAKIRKERTDNAFNTIVSHLLIQIKTNVTW